MQNRMNDGTRPEAPVSVADTAPSAPAHGVTAALPIPVRVGSPRVRPNVVPISGKTGILAREDLLTSFIIVWQPAPRPPSLWIRALREAPFGTELVRASDLRWDGKFLSVELVNESDIDAFAAEMIQWVDYANMQMLQGQRSPSALVLKEARRRAQEIENRLRK